ncbi:MAG TPA: hypothetical protein VKP30_22525, partial [Polyangiaceae bacterium]|nr:hypothetical protein [Polyangiaceae bacterium]
LLQVDSNSSHAEISLGTGGWKGPLPGHTKCRVRGGAPGDPLEYLLFRMRLGFCTNPRLAPPALTPDELLVRLIASWRTAKEMVVHATPKSATVLALRSVARQLGARCDDGCHTGVKPRTDTRH